MERGGFDSLFSYYFRGGGGVCFYMFALKLLVPWIKSNSVKVPLPNLAAAPEEEHKPKLMKSILLLYKQNHRSS